MNIIESKYSYISNHSSQEKYGNHIKSKCLFLSLYLLCVADVQFNYMHECFERVFCELKWRKEVRTISKHCNVFYYKPLGASLTPAMCMFLQVEEEATDKDNKNCSKDGMCGKVRLCLPLSSIRLINSLGEFLCVFVYGVCLPPECSFCFRIFSSS